MKQNYQFVSVSESDGRAVLALNRPPVNVLNIAMMQEINHALAEFRTNTTARALLIRGEGKCFSAGMDVGDHMPDKVPAMMREMHTMFERLDALEIPTVSAVHGSAMGGGLELAAFTDMMFAAAGTKLGVPEIKLGVFPPIAVACFLDMIGPKATYEMVLTGRTFSAEEAKSIGMVNAVFGPEEFEARTDEVLRILAGLSRPVLVATKRALRRAARMPVFEALHDAERMYMDEVMQTRDAKEGLSSFLEKRQPQWKHS
jgi:cyclohexa-1,5-dienecarbonyl-CoA hydratase